jgi:glucosamine 6-phosphate synthetase-like amidotransferase/phosphosugar isomerase protein
MTGNEILFSQKMGEATKILDELKGKNLYLKETRELSSRIEAMKKEIYEQPRVVAAAMSQHIDIEKLKIKFFSFYFF